MAILSLAIYGSRARGDYNDLSDIDLFAITDEEHYRMSVEGNSNLACYPKKLAIQRAINGDLFILHICEESREIYNCGFGVSDIKLIFSYKDDYSYEKLCAADLAWFLIDFNGRFKGSKFFNKRIAWCVRTVFIACSAELRKPVFSRDALVNFSGEKVVDDLIKVKESKVMDISLLKDLQSLLIKLGFPKPSLKSTTVENYHRRFIKTENAMGLKTIEFLAHAETHFGYN